MIEFVPYSPLHIFSLLLPCMAGAVFVFIARSTQSSTLKTILRVVLAVLLIAVRAARYGMDVYFGRFEIFDLLSLHLCHIDMILLAICLIRPKPFLFSFVFVLGIPAGLMVAFFPGSQHPVPGAPRAALFVMSHMMLVVGAVYLALTERLRVSLKHVLLLIGCGQVALLTAYFVNRALGSNFLYIMEAPPGTIIAQFDRFFSWPGYVLAMDLLGILLVFLMYGIWKLVFAKARPLPRGSQAAFATEAPNRP